jgi:PAS domain S-box-containing protein
VIRELIVPNRIDLPPKIFKQAVLRGSLAIIMFATGLTYIIIDLLYSVTRTIPIYAILIVIGALAFWLNRQSHFRISTFLILITGNIIVYILAASEPPSSGVFVFFIPATLAAMALSSHADWYWAFGMILLSFALFFTAYLVEFSILPTGTYSSEYDKVNFIINFTIGCTASVLIVYFLISLNHEAESSLLQNEDRLVNIAEELKQSRQRYEMALKGTKAGLYEWRLKENSIFLSPVWKEMLEYGPDEMNDLSVDRFIELTHPDDREKTKRSIEEHLAGGEPYQNELRLRTKSGTYKWFSDSGVSKRFPSGEIEMIVGSLVDIDERKRVEQQILEQNELLAQANAELDRFVYSVSHDLRAPLSSVRGLIGIAEKSENVGELKSYLSMMHDRIDALEKFIRDIIDYSRNARLEVAKESIDLNELVQEIKESLRFTDEMGVVNMINNIPEKMIITSDKVRLKIILNNLLSNALKYHDRVKTDCFVSIKAVPDHTWVRIVVEDNGVGIATDQLSKIFDMFYRASENSKGSGLGLYIARETVKKLNGKISVESKYGEGTQFMLELPAI